MFDYGKAHRRGCDLPLSEQRHVLSVYVHRYTREHVPAWAYKPAPHGKLYPIQFASDADWLAHTLFNVTKAGNVFRHQHADCHSTPTWPDGIPAHWSTPEPVHDIGDRR